MTNEKTISRSDEEILRAYRKTEDPKLIGELFNSYIHLVYGLCLKYLQSRADSQDAVMSIYEKISESLKTTEITHFKSWLYVVSRNYCMAQLRKKDPKINVKLFMESPALSHLNNENDRLDERLDLLDRCIDELKSSQQRCVRLFFLEKKSYGEIHELTGLTLNKVKSNIQNGKRNLKNCIEQKNGESRK